MVDIDAIVDHLDEYLTSRGKRSIGPVEAGTSLERSGLLRDSVHRPGLPLRKLLREGKIPHAYQASGKGSAWHIPPSHSNVRSENVSHDRPAGDTSDTDPRPINVRNAEGKWGNWYPFPSPENIRGINAPAGPGVYELRNLATGEYILVGISVGVLRRMKSLMPPPYGTGRRNNLRKRQYCLGHWQDIEYRTNTTGTRDTAALIERDLLSTQKYMFNT